jgi:hypothetical protein
MKKAKILNEQEIFELRMSYSHTQRFRILMKLIRISKMLQNTKITHSDKKM